MATISRSVTSADGSTISYFQLGYGPGLIVLHGILQTWRSHRDLAEYLALHFTVYLVDRRGRGTSSPPGPLYAMATEVQDVEALARATGARLLFGVSSGALIALQAGLKLPGTFSKIAVWEPPVVVDRAVHDELLARVTADLARGDPASALLTNMFMTDSAPYFLTWVPQWLLWPFVALAISLEWRDGFRPRDKDRPQTLRGLGPTMLNDLTLLKEMDAPVARFAALADDGCDLLILSGTASVQFFKDSCEKLRDAVPGATLTKLEGLTHLGVSNKGVAGNPLVVSKELKPFFERRRWSRADQSQSRMASRVLQL